MRVLIWTQYFWPENFHINAIARSLHAQGAEVTVLTGKPNYPEGEVLAGYTAWGIQKEECFGFEVIRIPLRPRGKGSAAGLALNYLSFIVSGYIYAPYVLRGKKFDNIFVYAPSPLLQALPAIYLAWVKHAPLTLWVQDIWPDALASTGFIKRRWILKLIGFVVRYIYCFSDSILIQSEGFRSFVERWTSKGDSIHFFPNSVENFPVDPPLGSPNSGLAKNVALGFSVVFAGNIGTVQNCETIIEAAALLQSTGGIKFYLIGTGSMAVSIGRSIALRGLENVVMAGRIPASEMSAIYASASVLLLTLNSDAALSATIPSKLQSYLAAGKPIIACTNGEAAMIVKNAEAGLTCLSGDAFALANAVLRLYEAPVEERARLGANGRKYCEAHYHLPTRVAELILHFKNVYDRFHKYQKKGCRSW